MSNHLQLIIMTNKFVDSTKLEFSVLDKSIDIHILVRNSFPLQLKMYYINNTLLCSREISYIIII